MGTVSPTIWRTMSAAPSATFEECDTITIPTLDMGSGSEFADNGGNHECGGPSAGIHMPDRSITKERGTAAYSFQGYCRLGGRCGNRGDPWQKIGAAARKLRLHGRQHIEHGFATHIRLASRLYGLDCFCESSLHVSQTW